MEDKINHDEFEEFLQAQVRNHRMYPGDAVWREIDRKLHGEKRWPALTIAAAMLVSATVLICVYFTPKSNIFAIPPANVNASTLPASDKSAILNNITTSIPFSKEKLTAPSQLQNNAAQNNRITAAELSIITSRETKPALANNTVIKDHKIISASVPVASMIRNFDKGKSAQTTLKVENAGLGRSASVPTLVLNSNEKVSAPEDAPKKNNTEKNNVSNSSQQHNSDIPSYIGRNTLASKSKFSYQIYIAPSVSYRKLLEDNSPVKENVGGPVGINFVTDVNKVVRHRPGTGIEAGISVMYNLSGSVRLKSGFQFNMRQYSIEAYRSSTELASIALIGGNNRVDTINTLAIYRTNNGYYSTQLVNRYYQLSLPIGIEWEILGNKLIQLNVAGTIQPTYLLNRNAYLLSTNFKNYTESPEMIRKWNINSNIEAFLSLKAGTFKWQLGPQLRYQPYSTFIPQYSIKEHLLDYGIKLGLSKSINNHKGG